jgi:hypothetical protein
VEYFQNIALTTVGWILNTLPRFDVVMRGVPNNFATGSTDQSEDVLLDLPKAAAMVESCDLSPKNGDF